MESKEENNDHLIVVCPRCDALVYIEQINCAIFRHGSFKSNGEQIPPHSSKEKCDALVKEGLIYGCGKPFRVIIDANGTLVAEVCAYI